MKKNKNRGITLASLVITIIVLLIIAGISVYSGTDIIKRAKLEELKTICKCGSIARYVGRKVNGNYVLEGNEIIIDGTDNVEYIPLCGDCYLKDVKKIDYVKVKRLVK